MTETSKVHRAKHRARLRSKVFDVPRVNNAISQANPLRSIGLGVPKAQADEFNKIYEDAGITGAYHEPDGTCVLESNEARNSVLKERGLRDNDACYRQHSGNN